jgi:ERCC4-type nuclease
MKEIFNIFSKEEIKRKENPLQKIIVDYREKNSLVISELISLEFAIEFKELKVADYLINDVAIERKTISDFKSSMINKRLKNQLEELKQYPNSILIIEGIDEEELYSDDSKTGISANAIRGFLISILINHKIPILFTKDYKDTAKFIKVLSKRNFKEPSLRVKKKSHNKKEQIQFILEGFPGIGPKTSKKLLEEFKSLKEVLNAKEETLKKILGKKSEIFKEIIERKY